MGFFRHGRVEHMTNLDVLENGESLDGIRVVIVLCIFGELAGLKLFRH